MKVRLTLTAEIELPDGTDLSKAYVSSVIDLFKDDSGKLIVTVNHDDEKIEVIDGDPSSRCPAGPERV